MKKIEIEKYLIDECRPDWTKGCENCGQSPIVPITGLCGPCTFGEAETIAGGWWDVESDEMN